MTDPRSFAVDPNRMTNLGPIAGSLGGLADYAAAIVIDETGAEHPMLVRLDAIDDSTIKVGPRPDVAHEQLGDLPVDFCEAIWLNTPMTQDWRARRRGRAR